MAHAPLACLETPYTMCGNGVCGNGVCVNASAAGGEGEGEAWRCECLPGWTSSLVEPSQNRCLLSLSFISAFLCAWLAASVLIVGLVVRGLRLGRLNRLRASIAMLSLWINIGIAVVGLALVLELADGSPRNKSPLRGVAFLALESLSVALFGSVNMALTVDKYIKAVRASASKTRHQQDNLGVSEDRLSPLTKLVLSMTFGGWLLCCVVWALLPDNAATGRVMVMLAYLCIVASTTVCNVHMSTAALLRGLAFAESQIDVPELLTMIRGLRSKLARTRRTIIVPGTLLAAVTGALLIMTMTPLAAELTHRVDYLALTWVPNYIANVVGHLSYPTSAKATIEPSPEKRVTADPSPNKRVTA